MNGIDVRRAARATREDHRVVYRGHKLGYSILKAISLLGDAVRVPGLGVVVNDAGLMRKILLDGEHFSKVGDGGSSELWTPIIGPNGLLNMDGPAHAHLRKKLGPLFSAKFVSMLVAESISPQMTSIKARLLDGHPVDITAEVEISAARIICRLTGFDVDGVSEDEVIGKLASARELLGLVKLSTKRFTPAEVTVIRGKLDVLNDSTREAYRRSAPDTVPALLREAGLNEEDTLSVVAAMVIAGTETIVSFVPRFTQLLLTSGHIEHLAANPGDVPAALTEGLRVTVPSPLMIRSVTTATTVGRWTVRPGERVILSNIMACQRAGDFDPFTPVPKDMRQIWFGAGAHFCIGMPLAQLEAQTYGMMLAEAFAARPFHLVTKRYKQRTIAAGYSELVIQC